MSLDLRSDDYKRKVDANVSTLVDAYRGLLKKGQVADKLEPHASLQLGAAVAKIGVHVNALLDQISELRTSLLILEQSDDKVD
jgi:hypothetical protein